MSIEIHDEWCRLTIHQKTLWQSYQQSHLVANREDMGGGNYGFFYEILLFIFAKYFSCHKILRQGTSGFTSPPNKGLLWIFIALKNPSPRQGFKPRTLDQMASTLLYNRSDYMKSCFFVYLTTSHELQKSIHSEGWIIAWMMNQKRYERYQSPLITDTVPY
jgi:hypothetical protein